MTVLQRQCMIIVTFLSTLLLLTVWPRFRNGAMSLGWFVYLILGIIFLITFLREINSFNNPGVKLSEKI